MNLMHQSTHLFCPVSLLIVIYRDLYQWWAQYLESTGDIESSLRYYELAHDWLSLVRLLCYLGSYEKAVQVANKVDDKASAYVNFA